MDRKRKKENSGLYIGLCCCAVIIAAVGYASRISLVEEAPPQNIAKIAEPTETPKPTAVPQPEVEEKPAEKIEENLEVNNNVEIEEPVSFEMPVSGKVIAEFSGGDLLYNEMLKDWRAHSGVDFESKPGEDVRASADGVVEDVFDSELGRCVLINHEDGFMTMYANLEEDTVRKGDIITKGDKIGRTGNTALGDFTEGNHLHFEVIKNGENVNPVEYLN